MKKIFKWIAIGIGAFIVIGAIFGSSSNTSETEEVIQKVEQSDEKEKEIQPTIETKIQPILTPTIEPTIQPSIKIVVKKSNSGICHAPGTTYYSRTTNYTTYNSIDECLASGGRLPKR